MIGFVDDSTSYCLATATDNHQSLAEWMQEDAQLWSDLLYLSGGMLEFSKCLYHLTEYDFHSSGEPILLPKFENVKITLHNFNRTDQDDITYRSPYEEHKTLGYYKSPSGNHHTQKSKLQHRSDR